jgi:hypothetical protein
MHTTSVKETSKSLTENGGKQNWFSLFCYLFFFLVTSMATSAVLLLILPRESVTCRVAL